MLKISIIIITILLGIVMKASSPCASRIPYSTQAPKISGTINSKEWCDAAILSRFSDAAGGNLTDNFTLAMVKYDDKNLYFAFRCKIAFDPKIEAFPQDAQDMYNVDSIEISIMPPGAKPTSTWSKFIFERGGGKLEQKVAGQVRLNACDWNPKWEVKCRTIPHAFFVASTWEAEVAIPWSSLGQPAPKSGSEWSVQITRNADNVRLSSNIANRSSSWAPVQSNWGLINPLSFGTFIFTRNQPVLRFTKYDDFSNGIIGIQGKFTSKIKAELSEFAWKTSDSNKIFTKTKSKIDGKYLYAKKLMSLDKINSMMMHWEVKDDFGKVASGTLKTFLKPPFAVEVAPIYSQDKVVFLGDLNKVRIPQNAKIMAELKNKSGKSIVSKKIRIKPDTKYFELSLPFTNVAAGDKVTAVAMMLNSYGKPIHAFSQEVKKVAIPTWMHKNYGKITKPPAGWAPVQVKKTKNELELEILKNSYRFGKGLLPEAIKLRDKPFSASALSFDIVTQDGQQKLKSDRGIKITSQDARGVTLDWHGASSDLKLKARIRVEFDGLAWYEITLIPLKTKLIIRSLSLKMPVIPEAIRYMRAINSMGTLEGASYYALVGAGKIKHKLPIPDMPFTIGLSGDGWKFENCFNNFYWMGGEDSGVFFVLPSMQNMHIKNNFSTVIDDDKNFEVSFNLIDHDYVVTQKLDYEFGFILTPSKTVKNPARLRRMGAGFTGDMPKDRSRPTSVSPKFFNTPVGKRFFHDPKQLTVPKDYLTTAMLCCWLVKGSQNGNPTPDRKELDMISREVAGIKKSIGGSPTLWYDGLFSMYHLPQAIDFQYEWERYPKTRLTVEQHGTLMCPTQTWSDYYLYGAKKRMKQGIESFYMDMTSFGPCSNRFHGCGYRDDNGVIKGKIPFLAGREMFLKYQNLVKSNNPNGIVMMHQTALSPLVLWVDSATHGEAWTVAKDYKTLALEFYQSSLMCTRQLGTTVNFFPGLILTFYKQAQDASTTLAEVCGLTFVHGESMWNGVPAQIPGLMLVWNALDKFGIDSPETQWIPYWRNKWSEYPKGVAISSYKRGGEELLVIFNQHEKNKRLNPAIFKNCQVVDTITGKVLKQAPTEIKKRDFRLLKLKKSK